MAKTRKVNKTRKNGKKREPSAWIKLVTKTFNENKHKKDYTFNDAIQDAKKVYNKDGNAANDADKGVTKSSKKASDQKGKGVKAASEPNNKKAASHPNKSKGLWESIFGRPTKKPALVKGHTI